MDRSADSADRRYDPQKSCILCEWVLASEDLVLNFCYKKACLEVLSSDHEFILLLLPIYEDIIW